MINNKAVRAIGRLCCFLIISVDIECAVVELLAFLTMVGNLFVDHLGVMNLTSKGIFINNDTNKGCESKA